MIQTGFGRNYVINLKRHPNRLKQAIEVLGDSNTTVIDLMVQNDTFRGVVSGVIRGARTVRINPTGSDTYETVLEIDQDMVAYLFRSAQTL